ncbi:hypothetical protein [Paracandidimonas soli]|uniref:hypothetical protein n=1 Tax=Paracandidimonas soli TaxID=1917182 RepID=UPI00333EA0BA
MLAFFEQKLLTLSRIALLVLGIIFLVLSIWWLAFSIPAIGSKKDEAQETPSLSNLDKNVMDLSELKESVWSASAYEIDAESFGQQDIARLTAKDPEAAAAYDEIIKSIRAFLERDPKKREAIEAQARENYTTLLAPVEWEALDKLSQQYCDETQDGAADEVSSAGRLSDSETAELAIAAAEASGDAVAAAIAAAEAATAANEAYGYENYQSCDYTTIRQSIVNRISGLMHYTKVDERAQMHKAYVQGLAQSIKPLLANEDMAARMATLPASRVVNILLDSYNNWFEPKLYSSSYDDEERLLSDASPLRVFKNPYFVGVIGFFFMFSYLMLMLSLSRIERHLRRPE